MASPRSISARDAVLVGVALASGAALAWMDSRPGFDAVGLTVGLLVIATALVTGVAGRWPWLWVALIGGPIPIVELPQGGGTAPLVALLFAAIGAAIGFLARRAVFAAPRPL